MESNRTRHRVRLHTYERQAGITVIGFLLLAAVFGTLGLAGVKIVPLYLERMRIGTVLNDLKDELAIGGNTAQGIRTALENRLYIENLELPRSDVDISQGNSGYLVKIDHESKAPFFADLWFVLAVNKQVEISR
jgi:hypothetical protein